MDSRGFPERLCLAMKEANINARELARQAGIAPSTLSHYKSGRSTKVTAEVAQKLADVLNVSVDWLVTGEGEREKQKIYSYNCMFHNINSLKELPEGLILIPEFEAHLHYNTLNYIEKYDCTPAYYKTSYFTDNNIDPKNCKRFVIKDDSMAPLIQPGDSVTVDCSKVEHIENNKIYALVYDNTLIVKRLMKTFKYLNIHSDNPKYQDESFTLEEAQSIIRIVGKVIDRSGPV